MISSSRECNKKRVKGGKIQVSRQLKDPMMTKAK